MDLPLRDRIRNAALAFRGYNVTNLGRSAELLAHPAYGPVMRPVLEEGSRICSEVIGREVNLIDDIVSQRKTTLSTFPEDIAMIVAVEQAQLRILEECFDVPATDARVAFGYSIGEMSALISSNVFKLSEILPVPLALAEDCAALAPTVTMAVAFSRGPALDMEAVQRLCVRVSCEGKGLIGPSAFLSPNTVLLLGENDTVSRFRELIPETFATKVTLRRNPDKWPPLHTPLTWHKNIPNRAALLLHALPGGFVAPDPPILSCVTGKADYHDYNVRDHLILWTDHPQRLWDVVYGVLAGGVDLVIHVGPEPNLIPATFSRLSSNVVSQWGGKLLSSFGRRVGSSFARSWLVKTLNSKAAVLRAPFVEHIILEDWLLEQDPAVTRDVVLEAVKPSA